MLFLGSSRALESSGARFVLYDVATSRLCKAPCHDELRIGDWRTNQFVRHFGPLNLIGFVL